MEQQAHELALGPADEGVQERVATGPVHVAQRGVGGHAIDLHLQALLRQPRGLGTRVGLVEVAPVADAARDRKAPGVQGERIGRRRDHVPHGGRALEVRIAAVASVVGQAQFRHCEGAGALGQLQALAQRDRNVGARDPVLQRLGRVHQLHMAAHRLPVVAERIAVAGAASQGQAGREGQQGPGAGPGGTRCEEGLRHILPISLGPVSSMALGIPRINP